MFLVLIYCGFFALTVFSASSQMAKTAVSVTPYVTPTPVELNADKLWNLVNEHRQKLGLKPFIKDQRLCDIAKKRVLEVPKDEADGIPHEGFIKNYHQGPYSLSENVNVHYTTEEDSLNGWIHSPPHRKALEGSWIYSCIATNNDIAVEIFSSFDAGINHNAP